MTVILVSIELSAHQTATAIPTDANVTDMYNSFTYFVTGHPRRRSVSQFVGEHRRLHDVMEVT
jgi:hypothetical protein